MVRDYSVQGTTKLHREKYANEVLALSTLDAPAPNIESLTLMREYIDGKCEISEVLKKTIERYKKSKSRA